MAKTLQALFIAMFLLGMLFFIILATKGSKLKDAKRQKAGMENLKQIGLNLKFYQKANKGKELFFPALNKQNGGLLEGSLKSADPYFKTLYIYSGQRVGDYTIAAGQPMPPKELMTDKVNLIIIKDAKKIATDKSTEDNKVTPYCLRGDLSVGDQN